ncbi:hypothetical protein L6R50_08975 [Myxococcota bacterium]|nr:hypothetical protein [Myxococcota bacterium]
MQRSDKGTVAWARYALQWARKARLQAEEARRQGRSDVARDFDTISDLNWASATRTLRGVLERTRGAREGRAA